MVGENEPAIPITQSCSVNELNLGAQSSLVDQLHVEYESKAASLSQLEGSATRACTNRNENIQIPAVGKLEFISPGPLQQFEYPSSPGLTFDNQEVYYCSWWFRAEDLRFNMKDI